MVLFSIGEGHDVFSSGIAQKRNSENWKVRPARFPVRLYHCLLWFDAYRSC